MRPPVNNFFITSPYGKRILNGKKQFHDGIDFISKNNDRNVRAVAYGKVVYDVDYYEHSKRWNDARHSGGNYIIVKHKINGKYYYCRYLHLKRNDVKNGQHIKEGDIIGEYEDVGISYGAHLHFDMYNIKWKKINPMFIIDLFKEE